MVSLAVTSASHLIFAVGGDFSWPSIWVLNPEALMGDLLFPLVSLAVAVILFEGSLTLNFKEIRGVSNTVWSIVTVGALVSWGSPARLRIGCLALNGR